MRQLIIKTLHAVAMQLKYDSIKLSIYLLPQLASQEVLESLLDGKLYFQTRRRFSFDQGWTTGHV